MTTEQFDTIVIGAGQAGLATGYHLARRKPFRKPTPQGATAETSPLNFLLDQLRSVRADLRFREDGIHTVLTIERGKGAKE